MRPSSESFVRRVRSKLDELSATERQLADFLLEFPGELASYAGNELAQLAGVSPSTVSRFIRHIGYDSYEEARRHVREEQEVGSPLFQPSSGAARHVRSVAAHFQQSQANLAGTFERLSDATMAEIAKAIAGAPQVLVFGSRSSHAFAVYLRWQIIQVLPRVTAIPGPGETLAEHTAGLSERDCVIVFGTRRQTRQMERVLDAASRAGARILYISDQASPDYAGATWSLQCQCRGPGSLDNHVAVMALCDLLATMVIDASGAAGRKRLAAVEQGHDELDDFG
ncbi:MULTISPECIES: MurR/RpiR family transcriptional regulator [unclassified Herbaspirillum]|uniref:MurR/RpiR family transcriptional regulator n=1 Tax=unclassified Herbaspirillum TaxID=2624150 RepID=UPI00114E8DF7|nr:MULTISPECIES: MurR/RpiR family transcriptional regulator [unclassified Herbaspirillum]MBB5392724.1 DNA-binding MurR/RpiR family transcriptional regulator [Herbaspirillum sp. SJZ102]